MTTGYAMLDTELCEYFDKITFGYRKNLTTHLRLDQSILFPSDAQSLSVVKVTLGHEDQSHENVSKEMVEEFGQLNNENESSLDAMQNNSHVQPVISITKNNVSLNAPRNLNTRKRNQKFNFGKGKYERQCANLIISPFSPTDLPMSPSSPVTEKTHSKLVIKKILDGIMRKREEPKKTKKMIKRRKRLLQERKLDFEEVLHCK